MSDDDHNRPHCFWCCPHMGLDPEDLVPDWMVDLPLWKFIPLAVLFWACFIGLFWWAIPAAFRWFVTHVPCPFGGP